jgi:hypothetical protein
MALTKIKTSGIADNAVTDAKLVDTITASNYLPLAGGALTGAVTTNSTFDGIDIATRDAVLTSTTTTAGAALPKAGGAMTGNITSASNLSLDVEGDITLTALSDIIHQSTSTNSTAGHHIFKSYNTEIMRIDGANNRVGIGVEAPAEILHLKKTALNSNVILKYGNDSRDWMLGVHGDDSDKFKLETHDKTDVIVVDSSGNVGIGGTPTANLEVFETISGTAYSIAMFENNDIAFKRAGSVGYWYGSDSNYRLMQEQIVSSGLVKWNFKVINAGTTYDNNLVLDRGKVGIGTASPAMQCSLYNSSTARYHAKATSAGASAGINFESMQSSGNTQQYEIGCGTGVGDDKFYIYDDTNDAVRLTIDTSGKVGIGISPSTYALKVDNVGNSGIFSGGIMSCGSFENRSDIRLKENIQPLEESLPIVNQLNPVTFNLKEEKFADEKFAGFIAQEIEKVFPISVNEEPTEDKYKSIKVMDLIALLTKSIQELSAKVEVLENS